MSLLLKALQRASKSRESLPRRTPGSASPAATTSTSALELEPGDIEPPRPARRALDFGHNRDAAGAAPKAAGRAADAMEWAREHPVPIFAAGALIFLAGYFVYVYLAINHPGFFTRSSSQDQFAQPVPPPRPVTPPPGNAPVAEAPPAQPLAPVPDLQIPAEPTPPGAQQAAVPSSLPPLPQPAASPVTAAAAPVAAAPIRSPSAPVASAIDDAPPPIAAVARPRRIRAAPTMADKTDRPRAAERPLEEGVQVRPTAAGDNAAARTTEGWEALQRQDFAKAQSHYEAALAADPRNVDALLGLAATAWQQGRPDAASEQYYRVLQLDPQNAQAQSGLIGLAGQVDPQASESRLKQLISHDPSAFLYAALGHLYAGQAQWSQAQQAYFQAFQLEPANPDYAYNLAVGLEHLGQRGIALGYYRKALDLARARGRAGFDQVQVTARVAKLAAATE
jgi:tetratricopeptide (TPR) repeat protein